MFSTKKSVGAPKSPKDPKTYLKLWPTLTDSGWLWQTLANSGWLLMTLADSGWLCLTLADSVWLLLTLADSGLLKLILDIDISAFLLILLSKDEQLVYAETSIFLCFFVCVHISALLCTFCNILTFLDTILFFGHLKKKTSWIFLCLFGFFLCGKLRQF